MSRPLCLLHTILLAGFFVFFTNLANAQIDPWIQSTLYDPRKWDTAGQYTATYWLHPPEWTPDQGWGVFSGKWRTAGALTGSWGGLRDRLAKHGVQLITAYFGQLAANPAGGEKQGESWKGDISTGIFLDLERLLNWKRGYFIVSFSYINPGKSLSPDFIENQFPVQLHTGDEDGAARLVHLAFGQQLFDNKAEIVLGRIITGHDFASLRLACTSINQAICTNPIAAIQSISFPTSPSAVWGARLKVKPGTNWYGQVGSYLVFEDFRDPDDHGFNFSIPSGSGVLTLGEFGYITGNYQNIPGLPGKYKIGAYYDSERLQELSTDRNVRGTWGLYIMGEQMLYSENSDYSEGLSAFLALSYAPENRNIITFMTAGGLSYQGLLPSRSDDIFAFIFAYGLFSDDLNEFNRDNGDPLQDYEVILELNYRIQIAPWLFLQPDVQFVINPDGRSDINDALVIGFGVGTVL
ncbi:MAG: carbohydrate porin [Candidatus Dadabacteria bacterium]|nr:carbohydrate porin [Candidatus Dadabacteria bacterium]